MKTTITRRTLATAVGLGLALGAVLALDVVKAEGTAKEVAIDNFTFGPADLSVPVGTTVTWVNRDDIPHSIVANDKGFVSKALDTNDRYSFTFTKAGTYNYFCGLHPHMTGKVIVTQ